MSSALSFDRQNYIGMIFSLVMALQVVSSYVDGGHSFIIGIVFSMIFLLLNFSELFLKNNTVLSRYLMALTFVLWTVIYSFYHKGIFEPSLFFLPLFPILVGVTTKKNFKFSIITMSIYLGLLLTTFVYTNVESLDELVRIGNQYILLNLSLILSNSLIDLLGPKDVLLDINSKLNKALGHDIKSPLFIIKNSLNKLPVDQIDDKLVNRMKKALYILEETTDSVLRANSYHMKKNIDINESYLLSDIVSDLRELYRDRLSVKNISLVIDENSFSGVRINLPPKDIQKFIFSNLMSNALKFSKESSQIYLYLKKDDDNVIVYLKDYGVGLTDEVKATTGTVGETGLGLGLQILRSYLKDVGGYLTINSYDDVSTDHTLFSVHLPCDLFSFE